jgi:hypothetical protein
MDENNRVATADNGEHKHLFAKYIQAVKSV